MRACAWALFVVLLAAAVRLYKIDLAPFHDVDAVRDWERALSRESVGWWEGPDVAISTGTGARLPGGAYYWMLRLASRVRPDPLAGTVLTALVGTAAAGLSLWVARAYLPAPEAFLASLTAASAPVWVLASRQLWNPHLVPLFAALFHGAFARWMLAGGAWALVLAMLAASLLVQLHLSALALAPLVVVALLKGLRRPAPVVAALVVAALPLLPFLSHEVRTRGEGSRRLLAALREVVARPSEGVRMPWVGWPLPYLPPLTTLGYGDTFLDRHLARELLSGRSPDLGVYWKGPQSRVLRSFALGDVPRRLSAHAGISPSLKTQFWADTISSWVLSLLTVAGVAVTLVDALRGDPRAGVLALALIPMLVCTRLEGVADSHHFYLVFFPLPALLAARAVSRMEALRGAGRAALWVAAAVGVWVVVAHVRDLEVLGGTPTWGVPHRYREEVARCLRAREVRRGDLEVVGVGEVWDLLLPPGRGSARFTVIELSESAIHRICPTGGRGCGVRWQQVMARVTPRAVCRAGAMWVVPRAVFPERDAPEPGGEP